jgi:rubrerythrin
MSEEFEMTKVVAEYDNEAEALTAQEALHAAGIECNLTKDNAMNSALFGGMQYAPIRLAVAQSRMAAALMVLAQFDQPPDEGWEAKVEGAVDGWICLNCDTVVAQDEAACPECGSLRSEQPQQDEDGKDEEEEDE